MDFLKNAAIFIILLSQFSGLFAQQYLFDAEHITTDDGLANLMTTSIFKDKHGFLWIGTSHGLNRYDGYTFKLFTKEENGLRNNADIHKIVEDGEGNLWLFYIHINGFTVDIFNVKSGQAVPFDDFFGDQTPFKNADIYYSNIVDPENMIWVTTKEGQLYLYENRAFKKIVEQKGTLFRHVTFDLQGNIWMAWENKLICMDSAGQETESLTAPGRISGLWHDRNDQLWLTTVEGQHEIKVTLIWAKAKNADSFEPFTLYREGQVLGTVKQAIQCQNGFWYAYINGHLHFFDALGKWQFDFHTLLANGEETGFLAHFETDNQVWFATAVGVIKTSVKENPFSLIHSRDGLADCRSITEDEAGNIYFLDAKAYRWNPKNQGLTKLPITGGNIGLQYFDSTLWAGSYGPTVLGFQFDLRTNQETHYAKVFDSHVLTFLKTKTPGLYLVGLRSGIAYLDLKNKKHLPFNRFNGFDQLNSCNVYHFHKNETGIWLATELGIFLMDVQKGIIRHFDKASGDLPFDHIRHIHEDKDGTFWLATRGGGVINWQPAMDGGTVPYSKQFTVKNGLSNNYTYAIYEDDFNKLWIPSDKGLMCMDKNTYEVRTYLTDHGLPHNEFNMTSHYQSKDGTLYFGGLGGLISFHPKIFANEPVNRTPLEFTGYYLLENKAEEMTEKTDLLSSPDGITIRPSDKLFELHFAFLDYQDMDQHRYAFKIEGFSERWQIINENYIRITNLPYGSYTLKIKGQNLNHGWSEQELSLGIRALKPFYLQWWFIASAAIALIGFTGAFIRWRIAKLQHDRERLEMEVQKRTRQIEADKQIISAQAEALQKLDKAKTRFFSNITHEFRTPLTLIIGPMEQLLGEQTNLTYRKRLNGVIKNARHLMGLINQLLDLSKLEGSQMKLEITHGDIIEYTQELVSRFQPLATENQLQLHGVMAFDLWETNFDKHKWNKIVYNLLSNAIKFTSPGGAIQLSINKIEKGALEFIHLTVKDTGAGIEKTHLDQIFNRFYQADSSSTRTQGGTGIGLSLVKELVELQEGEITVKSEVGKGTSFSVILPVLQLGPATICSHESELDSLFLPTFEKQGVLSETGTIADNGEQKLELLIIEDNQEMREYIRQCIDISKYNIIEASNGEEGIQKAQINIPDLIISDIMMPKKNGFEVVKSIRNDLSTSHIPLILLTAKASLESRLEGLRHGADAYLSKPFSPHELAMRIQKLIETRRSLQQRYQSGHLVSSEEPFQQEDEFITDLRDYILENINDNNLNGDHIGKHFGMSRVHLHRKLKALTDQPITEFVRSVRMQKAMELIRERKLNISEVAYQTGFASPSHFSRTFKKQFGKEPSKV